MRVGNWQDRAVADHRYNSPPNWPAPPQGWTPPEGWQPDPAWGPAPEGWQFWTPEGAVPGGRPNRGAWGRTAIIAVISVVLLAIIPAVAGADNLAQVIGFFAGRALMAYLITAAWAFFSRKHWGWGRYVLTFFLATLVLTVIGNAGGA